ncbi:hypothetical protein ABZ923_15085 [Streptomyces sp. NPDC046881]|uniref:hypothetical protein n=1 Tax=Streptomyces sp. NPDC046881 TaxID=3155374 RepID=UPI0033CB0F37
MSDKRATSVGTWVFEQITAELTAAGQSPPASVEEATNFDIVLAPCEAAALVNPVPTSEAQRAQNRRVQFVISTFTP